MVIVISPKHKAVRIYIIECFLSGNFTLHTPFIFIIIYENTAPRMLEAMSDVETDDNRITFFIKTASRAEKNNAKNLYLISFRIKTEGVKLSKIKYVPNIINITPIIPYIFGISCSNIIPKINPITALYEFIGPSTDSSPYLRAITIKLLHNAPAIPPRSA